MKNIKLILLILFAFILVPVAHAEECDEETINQMREEISNSDYSLKLEYNEKEKSMYAKIEGLPEGYEAFLILGEDAESLSTDDSIQIQSGINYISFRSKACLSEVFYSSVKVPYYDANKKNVFADGSIVEDVTNRINIKRILLIVGLVIVIIGLGIVGYVMIKGRLKHEK